MLSSQGGAAAAEEYLLTQGSSHGMMSAICHFNGAVHSGSDFTKPLDASGTAAVVVAPDIWPSPETHRKLRCYLTLIFQPSADRQGHSSPYKDRNMSEAWGGPAEGSLDKTYGAIMELYLKRQTERKYFSVSGYCFSEDSKHSIFWFLARLNQIEL